MDATTFLSTGLEAGSSAEGPPKLDYRDFQRSFILLASYRSGSHMLKLSMGRLANILTPPEPLNQYAESESGFTLKEYFSTDLLRPKIMTEASASVHHFLQHFYNRMPETRRIVLDIKYPQAYAFGVNADMDYSVVVPTFLEEAHKLGMPFVHLVRKDKIAQAVSLLVAEGTGVYLNQSNGRGLQKAEQKIRLSPRQVFERATRFQNAAENARTVLAALGATTLEVTYEDLLAENWRDQYRRVFQFLDRYADIPEGFVPPTAAQNSSDRVSNIDEIRSYAANKDPSMLGF